MHKDPILIAGLPRSGTTWIGEILRSDSAINYYYEPDNEKVNTFAWFFKRDVHRFPFRVDNNLHDDYYLLWQHAFAGIPFKKVNTLLYRTVYKPLLPEIEAYVGNKVGFTHIDSQINDVRPSAYTQPDALFGHPLLTTAAKFFLMRWPNLSHKRVLIKSVHSALCLKWLDSNFKLKIVVVLRNPFALYASYKRLAMPDAYRNILFQQDFASYVRQQLGVEAFPRTGFMEESIFQILIVYKLLATQLQENSHWYFVSHDKLCFDPIEEFKKLYNNVHLTMDSKVEQKLDSLNTSGGGFIPKRISKDQPMKWKNELPADEIKLIEYWIQKLELEQFIGQNILGCDL